MANKKNDEHTEDLEQTLDDLDELTKQDEPNVGILRKKIEKFKDGIELISGDHVSKDNPINEEGDDKKEELTTKELKQLYRYVNGVAYVSDDEIKKLDKDKIDKMLRVSEVMMKHMPYMSKKQFGVKFKQKRKKKNRSIKASRKNNR